MNLSAYVGLPFVERGRNRSGCDCWGLFVLVQREVFGLDLPAFSDAYATVLDRAALADLIAGHMGPWREIDPGKERPGDAVLMRLAGSESHIGIVAGQGRVLHTERGAGSVIESYRETRLRRRVAGFYRHVEAA